MEALFAGLTLRAWTARKHDKEISIEVSRQHAATKAAGRYTKRLLPEAKAYEKIISALSEARAFHYANTLASHLDGWRILTGANFERYSEGIRQRRQGLDGLVAELVAAWPAVVEQARKCLSGMFREEDYPDASALAGRFGIEVRLLPLPDAEAFCADMPPEQIRQARENIRRQEEEARSAAIRDLWEKLYEPVFRMVERLSRPEAIFRDSLVENLREIVEVLPRLDVSGDGRFAELLDRVRALSVHEPQRLREDKALRADVAARAADIEAQIRAFMEGLS